MAHQNILFRYLILLEEFKPPPASMRLVRLVYFYRQFREYWKLKWKLCRLPDDWQNKYYCRYMFVLCEYLPLVNQSQCYILHRTEKNNKNLAPGGGTNHMGRASPVNWAVLPRSHLSSEVEWEKFLQSYGKRTSSLSLDPGWHRPGDPTSPGWLSPVWSLNRAATSLRTRGKFWRRAPPRLTEIIFSCDSAKNICLISWAESLQMIENALTIHFLSQ